MFKRDVLDDYFMKPQYIDGIGNIYPISIKSYEIFRELSGKYIINGIKTLHNLYKVDENTNVFDYILNMSIKGETEYNHLLSLKKYEATTDEEKQQLETINDILIKIKNKEISFFLITELEELFSLILKSKVKFNPNLQSFVVEGNNDLNINRFNFDIFREVVMWQNILFEPLTSPSKFGNQAIQRAINAQFKDSNSSLASIISVVKCNSGITDSELENYSYYRLIYDFTTINRTHGNIFSFMLRSQGCSEATINNLSDEIDLHKNPYDGLLTKHNYSKSL